MTYISVCFIAGNDRSHQALNCHAADFKGKCHSYPLSRPQEKHGQKTSLESPRGRNRDFVVAKSILYYYEKIQQTIVILPFKKKNEKMVVKNCEAL